MSTLKRENATELVAQWNATHPDDPLTLNQFIGQENAAIRKLRRAFRSSRTDTEVGAAIDRVADSPEPPKMGRTPRGCAR